MKTLTLMGLMATLVGSAFAQGMDNQSGTDSKPMMQSGMMMDDVDYSAWKPYFLGMRRGEQMGSRPAMMEMPMMNDVYDEKVFKFIARAYKQENMVPARPFDMPITVLNSDSYFALLEKKANVYRRELMREEEARMMMMGKGMTMDKKMMVKTSR